MISQPQIVIEQSGHVLHVKLSAADKRNCINAAMWRRLEECFATINGNNSIRLIVLTGAGGHFSSGADIAEFVNSRTTPDQIQSYDALVVRAVEALSRVRVPTLAVIRGVCFGAGLALAAACDIRLASDDARFAIPAGRLGLAYPLDLVGIVQAAFGTATSNALLLSGSEITAKAAAGSGFLSAVLAASEIDDAYPEVVKRTISLAPLSLKAAKLSIAATRSLDADLLKIAKEACKVTYHSADYREGLSAFLEKRPPRFEGR